MYIILVCKWQCIYPQDCILIWIYRTQINYITSQHLTDLWVKGNWHCTSLLEANAWSHWTFTMWKTCSLTWPLNGKWSWRANWCNIHLPIMWPSWLTSCSYIKTFTTLLFLTTISLVLYILKIFAVNVGYVVSFFYIVSVPK